MRKVALDQSEAQLWLRPCVEVRTLYANNGSLAGAE